MTDRLDEVLEDELRSFATGEDRDELGDARVLRSIVDRHASTGSRVWIWGAGAAALAVAAALALWWGRSHEPQHDYQAKNSGGVEVGEVVPEPAEAGAEETPQTPHVVVASGVFTTAEREVARGNAIELGTTLRSTTAACLGLDAGRYCVDGPSQLRVEPRRLVVRSGAVDVEIPGGSSSLRVDTALGTVNSSEGQYSVRVTESADSVHSVIITVIAGQATVTEASGAAHELVGPATLELGDAVPAERETEAAHPAKRPLDRDGLLERAQAQRAAGQLRAAAQTYAELANRFGDSAQGRTALVSMGQLRLDIGQPGRALEAFDRYLETGGVLAQDARYGRVRALIRLGRDDEAKRAVEDFERRHPKSAYLKTMRSALEDETE